MCDYCEKEINIELNRQDTDTNIYQVFIHTVNNEANLFIRQPKWYFTKTDKIAVEMQTKYAYVNIKYCPFCGRELTK